MKLLDYIRGLRKGKEAHRLEKESMQDPFLADAMDGYSQVEGKHEQRIEKLRMQVSAHSAKRRNSYVIGWSVAACLVIGIGISTYFLLLKNSVGQDAFIAKEDIPSEITPAAPNDEVASLSTVKVSKDSVHEVTAKAAPVAAAPVMEETAERIAKEKEIVMTATAQPKSDSTKMRIIKASAPSSSLIKGKVTDNKGEPILGASVYYKGTNIGSVTDYNGEFAIAKEEGNKKLIVNFIGYNAIEIPVDTSRTMLIAMNEDKQKLDEVVVVGYGKQKKSTVVGSNVISDKQTESHTPEPVIGMRQYRKYLKENLNRPTDESCVGIKGKVVLTFLVDSQGRPHQIEVKKSLCESADKEAIRLIQEGPDWTRGNQPVEITMKF